MAADGGGGMMDTAGPPVEGEKYWLERKREAEEAAVRDFERFESDKKRAGERIAIRDAARGPALKAAEREYREGFKRGEELTMGRATRAIQRAEAQARAARDEGEGYVGRMRDWRYYVIDRFRQLNGDDISVGKGYYYCTVQMPLLVEGTAAEGALCQGIVTNPAFPSTVTGFDIAQQGQVTWIGGQHTLGASDTNLTNPGQTLFTNELMIIERVAINLKGIRIVYAPPIPAGVSGVEFQSMLNGLSWVDDKNGLVLPTEIWNPLDGSCRLAEVIGDTSTLTFNWVDRWAGSNQDLRTVLVSELAGMPNIGRRERDTRMTSGGALEGALDIPEGNIWCLDQNWQASSDTGGNGLFSVGLQVSDSMAYPFTPITPPGTGASGPALPLSFALYFGVTVFGTSLLPGRIARRREKGRIRHDRSDHKRFHRALRAGEREVERGEREEERGARDVERGEEEERED